MKKKIPPGCFEAPLEDEILLDLQIAFNQTKLKIKEERWILEDYCVTCIQSGKSLGDDPLVYRQSKIFNDLIETLYFLAASLQAAKSHSAEPLF